MQIPEDELWSSDAMVATIMASKFHKNTEPVCVILVAPSGWGKTEMIRPILDWHGVGINFSVATTKALASGSPGAGKSLLNKLDRRVLVIKDFTTVFSSPEAKVAFFGTIREAYDGLFDKWSGAMDSSVAPRGRFVIFAGMVPNIYTKLEHDQDLGYRYLLIWLRKSLTLAQTKRIQQAINDNWGTRNVWRDQIKMRVRNALERLRKTHNTGLDIPPIQGVFEKEDVFKLRVTNYEQEKRAGFHKLSWPEVTLSPSYSDWVCAASRVLSYIRLGSGDPMKADEEVPSYTGESERSGPFRAQKQLNVLVHGRIIADERTTTNDDDIEFGRAVTRDSIAPSRLLLLDALYKDARGAHRGLQGSDLHYLIKRNVLYTDTVIQHMIRTGFFRERKGGLSISLSNPVLDDIETARMGPRNQK